MAGADPNETSSRAPRVAWILGVLGVIAGVVAIARCGGDEVTEASRRRSRAPARDVVRPEPRGAPEGPAARASAPELRAGHRVGGVVIDPETGPLDSGRVEFWCEDGRPIGRGRIDEDGRFSGPGCAEQTCLRLTHPSFEQPTAWMVASGVEVELEVERAPSVSGVVLDPEGEPLADASLILARDGGPRATSQTDTDGAFAVALARLRPCDPCDRSPEPGQCAELDQGRGAEHARMLVSAPEFAPVEVEVAIGGEPIEVALPRPAAPITGVVRGSDGAPITARTKILATHVERPAERHQVAVDEGGAFELRGLGSGRYDLRAIRDERELARAQDVAPGETIALTAATPARGATLSVELVDDAGAPVGDARVDGGPFSGQRSDASGEVVAPAVLPGDYALRVRAGACAAVRSVVEVPAGVETVRARIELSSACTSL